MRFWNSFLAGYYVEITTAAPESLISLLNLHGVRLRNVQCRDPLTICFELNRKDYRKACYLAEKNGAQIKVLSKNGFYWYIRCLIKRPAIIVGVLSILILTLLLPTRILFVDVEGCGALPASIVVEKAELCGITFGATRRHVRSEATKNRLLSILPELRWVGVNTYGCIAVITVEEKENLQIKDNDGETINHIVAAKDCIISNITILRGAGQCKVGQAVCKGQILVSGYIDHGISIEATGAEAEIEGYTGNILRMITPTERLVRCDKRQSKTRYQLLIGKKLINFSKGSGISDVKCVRMYKERCLTLPGGFRLPLSIVRETTVSYLTEEQNSEHMAAYNWMDNAAKQYLQSQMLSGEILRSNTFSEVNNGQYMLYGTYQCREIIGRVRSEGTMIDNE